MSTTVGCFHSVIDDVGGNGQVAPCVGVRVGDGVGIKVAACVGGEVGSCVVGAQVSRENVGVEVSEMLAVVGVESESQLFPLKVLVAVLGVGGGVDFGDGSGARDLATRSRLFEYSTNILRLSLCICC